MISKSDFGPEGPPFREEAVYAGSSHLCGQRRQARRQQKGTLVKKNYDGWVKGTCKKTWCKCIDEIVYVKNRHNDRYNWLKNVSTYADVE